MKKTLLVTLDFTPAIGGISRYWESLLKHLPPERIVVLTVPVLSAPPPLVGQAVRGDPKYSVYRRELISAWWSPHWLPMIWHICRVIRTEKIEHVIAAQVLPVGTAVMIASRIMRVPYSVSAHGMDVMLAWRSARKRVISKYVFSLASNIFANSDFTASQISRFSILGERITLVRPCPVISPEQLPTRQQKSDETRKPLLLTIARLVKRKGFDTVVDALALLKGRGIDVPWVIIGEGPYRGNIERRVKQSALHHVRLLGKLSDEEISTWLHMCTALILTPFEEKGDVEGFGVVYLEANAFGKPVIGSKTGGVAEAVLSGVTGLLIEPLDSRQCAVAIEKLLSDAEFAERLGRQGKERIEKEFRWDIQAQILRRALA